MSPLVQTERMDRLVRIEKPVPKKGFGDAGSGRWEIVEDDVRAEVQDMLPSRGERMEGGLRVTTQRARVRMRWREGITGSMRLVMDGRIMNIVSGPAELGRQDGLELLVETAGSGGTGA